MFAQKPYGAYTLSYTPWGAKPGTQSDTRRRGPWNRRARVLRPLVFLESLFATFLLGTGIALSGSHDATAAELVIGALLIALSLIVIEPATTRASLPQS